MTDVRDGAAGPTPAPADEDEWARFHAAQRNALAALVAGDPRPFQQLWDPVAHVSLLGAFGGAALGWDAVRDRLGAVAAAYRDGVYERLEVVTERVEGPVGYTVHLESIRARARTGEPVLRERRVTKVYRRDRAGWRIVHMHSDPLVATAFPDAGPRQL